MMAVAAAFVTSLVIALAVTPLVRRVARNIGWVAKPTADRWHTRPTALAGGVAIFAGALAGMAAIWWSGTLVSGNGPVHLAIFAAAAVMFVVGFVDDRMGMRPSAKLIAQGAAAAILVSAGVVYPLTPWVPINVLATMFWFIALTNGLNLLDNMDGAAAGIAAIAAAFLAIGFGMEGDWGLAALCATLVGAAVGFLPYNFSPASIFMGDSGSLFLGALLASLGAAYPGAATGSVVSVLFVPVILVAIPILDTSLVTLTRTLAGRPISLGGRDHTAHRLVAFGLSEPQAVLALYGFAVAGGVLALVISASEAAFGLWLGGLFLIVLVVLAAYLTRLHSYSDQEQAPSRRTELVSNLLYKRRAAEVVLDLVVFSVAYYGAYLLRWEADLPLAQRALFEQSLAIAVVAKSMSFGFVGVYRGVWGQATVPDLHRILKASVLGGLLTVGLLVLFFPGDTFSRSVLILDTLLVALLASAARMSFRSIDSFRSHVTQTGRRTIIYGAGRGGDLVLREMRSNKELGLKPVGYIDDARHMRQRLIHGLPVLGDGSGDRIGDLLRAHSVEAVVIATDKIPPERYIRVERACREMDLQLYVLSIQLKVVPEAGGATRDTDTDTDTVQRLAGSRS